MLQKQLIASVAVNLGGDFWNRRTVILAGLKVNLLVGVVLIRTSGYKQGMGYWALDVLPVQCKAHLSH